MATALCDCVCEDDDDDGGWIWTLEMMDGVTWVAMGMNGMMMMVDDEEETTKVVGF